MGTVRSLREDCLYPLVDGRVPFQITKSGLDQPIGKQFVSSDDRPGVSLMKSEVNPDLCQSRPVEFPGERNSAIWLRELFGMICEAVTAVLTTNKKAR